MKVTYEYDQDPRYGWVNIDMKDKTEGDVVIQDKDGRSYGFTFREGEMIPTCICNAWNEGECGCVGVDWS